MRRSRILITFILTAVLIFSTAVRQCAWAYEEDDTFTLLNLPATTLYIDDADLEETFQGDITADAIRYCAGTEIALVSAGDLSNKLYNGEVTWKDIQNAYPADRKVAVVTVTVQQLLEMLEHAVEYIEVDVSTEKIVEEDSHFEGFLCASGITYTYDVSANVGSRIRYLYDADGNRLNGEDADLARTFTLAAPEELLSGAYDYPVFDDAEVTDITLADAVAQYLPTLGEEIDSFQVNRLTCIGSLDNPLISHIPIWAVALLCALFPFTALFAKKRAEQLNP